MLTQQEETGCEMIEHMEEWKKEVTTGKEKWEEYVGQ